jgi:hypothetical protein
LENPEEKKYAVIITEPADIAFYEVLDYLYGNYPIERTEEIAEGLRDTVRTLESKPEREALESRLLHRQKSTDLFYTNAHQGQKMKRWCY